MTEGGRFPICTKHGNKKIQQICMDLDCSEILLCEQCQLTKKHKEIVDLNEFVGLDTERIQRSILRLQNMRKRIIELNEKVSNQKTTASLIVQECFTQIQQNFLQYIEASQQSVLNSVSLFSERFRKIFSKLLQEISDDTFNIKKHINRLSESLNNAPTTNYSFDNYTITQGLKSVQYSIIHKAPHLEKICEDLEEKQKLNLINTDSIRNNFDNIQIDLQRLFEKLSLNSFPTQLDSLSLEYELQPPKVNYNSIYAETVTQVQLEQSIFAHLNPISAILSVPSSVSICNQQKNTSSQYPSSQENSETIQMISTGWDGAIKAWNIQKSQPIIEINTYNGGISAAALEEKESILVCSHFNYSLEMYQLDLNPQKDQNEQMHNLSKSQSLYENEDSNTLDDAHLNLLKSQSTIQNKDILKQQSKDKKYSRLGRIDPHEKNIQSIIVKGNKVICGCSTSNILCIPIDRFDVESTEKLSAHTTSVQSLCDIKSANNQYFLSGSNDSLVYLWDLRKHKPVNMVQNSNEIVNSFSQLSEFTFITGSHDSFIKVWDIRMFKNLKTIFAHRDAVSKTASFYSKLYNTPYTKSLSYLSNMFISSGNDNIVNFWNFFDKQSLRFSMKGHTDVVWAMDIDLENKKVYTGSRNEEIKIWSFS